jgi:hypothetical protein
VQEYTFSLLLNVKERWIRKYDEHFEEEVFFVYALVSKIILKNSL